MLQIRPNSALLLRIPKALVNQKSYRLIIGECCFIMVPPSRPLRKGRGNRTAEDNRFKDVTRSALHSVHTITTVADSSSSVKNVKRARKVLADYMNRVNNSDPEIVKFESSKLIANLLSNYCETETEDALSDAAMGDLLQRIMFFYDEAGHR